MDQLIWEGDAPELRSPALVCAFSGWNDAASAASAALEAVAAPLEPDLVERLNMSRSSYEGPTGIVGVIHDACREAGMTSASLWAAVPHYVAAVPNPKAALALLRRLEGLTGVAVEASELEDATERFEEQIDRAVSANPEIEELVRNLEASQEQELEMGR